MLHAQVLELLEHKLANDEDYYWVRAHLADGTEAELVMHRYTFRPGTHISGVPQKTNDRSRTGLPIYQVNKAMAHAKPGRLVAAFDRAREAVAGYFEELGLHKRARPAHEALEITPGFDERNGNPQADYRHKCGQGADLSEYNRSEPA